MSISPAIVGCLLCSWICSGMILIGLDSSSRHSSHSTPASAGRCRHTGHITASVYHHGSPGLIKRRQASPGLTSLLPGSIAAPEPRDEAQLDLHAMGVTGVLRAGDHIERLDPQPQVGAHLDGECATPVDGAIDGAPGSFAAGKNAEHAGSGDQPQAVATVFDQPGGKLGPR